MKKLLVLLFILFPVVVWADWDITKPSKQDTASQVSDDTNENFVYLDDTFYYMFVYKSGTSVLPGFDDDTPSNIYLRGPVLTGTTTPSSGKDGYVFVNTAVPSFWYYSGGWNQVTSTSSAGVSSIGDNYSQTYMAGKITIWPGVGITTTSNMWGSIRAITITNNYEAGGGLTRTYAGAGSQLTVDGSVVSKYGKRRDIQIGAYSIDDTSPPEISQTFAWTHPRGAYNTLIFDAEEQNKVHFDFTLPADIDTASDIYVDVLISAVTSTAGTIGYITKTSGNSSFSLGYSSYTPIAMTADVTQTSNMITRTVYEVTTTRFIGESLGNVAYLVPLTITGSNVNPLDEIYCTIDRCGSCDRDTFNAKIRVLNISVHGIDKKP